MPPSEAILQGQTLTRATRQVVTLPITVGLGGSPIDLTVHALCGREEGPVLTLVNTMHGGEWLAMEAFRILTETTDLAHLRGTVLMVPVANPPAFVLGVRNMPDQVDSPDVNRIFPGPLTATSDQLVAALAGVFGTSSCIIDFHMGPLGSAFRDVLVGNDFAEDVSRRSLELALAFGSPIVRSSAVLSGFPGPRSTIGFAGSELGIPALGAEVGGAGFGPALENLWRTATVDGLRAVMGVLDMVDDAPDPRPHRQLVYSTAHRVNPRVGGIVRPRFTGEMLGVEVQAGVILGDIVSPYTNKVVEELSAPVDGLLYYVSRDAPIYPGGWAFGVADTSSETSYWVDHTTEAS